MLQRLLRLRRGNQSSAPESECAHEVLLAHWAKDANIGDEDKADRFTCESCRQQFSLAQAQGIRIAQAESNIREFLSLASR